MHIHKKLLIKLKIFSISVNSKQFQEPKHLNIKQIIGFETQNNKVKIYAIIFIILPSGI